MMQQELCLNLLLLKHQQSNKNVEQWLQQINCRVRNLLASAWSNFGNVIATSQSHSIHSGQQPSQSQGQGRANAGQDCPKNSRNKNIYSHMTVTCRNIVKVMFHIVIIYVIILGFLELLFRAGLTTLLAF